MKAKLSSTLVKDLKPKEKAFEVSDSNISGLLLRIQPTGRKTFYFSYRTLAGKRKRAKIGVFGSEVTVAQARDKALIFAGKVADGADIQEEKNQAKRLQKSTLGIFLEESYKPWALTNLKSGQHTVDTIHRSLPHLLDLPMSDISIRIVEKWRIERLQAGTKPSSINRMVSSLRGILTKAEQWEVIPVHPLRKLKPLKIDEASKARYLSDIEENALFHVLSERDDEIKASRDRANEHRTIRGYSTLPCLSDYAYGDRMTPLIILSLKTGMRRSEIFDLTWESINFKNKVLTVHGETAKSSKTRHIPLSPIALKSLLSWQDQTDAKTGRVFPADDGTRLDNVNTAWRNILKKAGIKAFRWHDMRHDFASKLVMKGVPLNTVRELCGHADLNTTLRYAHLAPDHKSDAIALLG